jgi:hypothetical protein
MPLRLSRRSKYGNRKTVVDGHTFDSQAEANYYRELCLRKAAREIYVISGQPTFDLTVNGRKVCRYRADFLVVKAGGEVEVIDVKGMKTSVYRLKAKLFEACMGFSITEVKRGDR